MTIEDRSRGCLLGLAVGDAVGTTLEFSRPGTFAAIEDMVGGGPFGLNPGEWTDDTSMALCLGTSLVSRNGFDAKDQMNRYVNWRDHGYMSSNGECFDIGGTVAAALENYLATEEPFSGSTDLRSAGNGSLMRLAPVPLFYHPNVNDVRHYARESSRTTHAALECLDACQFFAERISIALSGASKEAVLTRNIGRLESQSVSVISSGSYRDKSDNEIRGTGYVIDCLEAAMWSFDRTSSFREAVLCAANLGDDADTTGAVCSQLAGARSTVRVKSPDPGWSGSSCERRSNHWQISSGLECGRHRFWELSVSIY